ncbi:MAG: hypothetical protein JO168_07750 [Solirubrobacterales bacterium]|nr:hypothetical protein [Solirubrobacterales bacterium]
MRLLLVNPNTSSGLTERMASAARLAASAGVEIDVLTAHRGFPYIASRAEADIAAAIVLEMLAEHAPGYHAAIVGAFGDPGLAGARELLPIPVVGLAEAAMLSACMLGSRFAILTFSSTLVPWYRDCVGRNGLGGRCAGVFVAGGGFTTIDNVQAEMAERIVEAAQGVIAEAEADVVVFGGAPLAGLAERVKERIPVPVVDCVAAAVKQAEALVALRPHKAVAGSFRRPPGKPSTGLAEPLASLIAGTR